MLSWIKLPLCHFSVWLLLASSFGSLADSELKPFYRDSYQAIQAQYQGKPFLVSLWSLDCPPCMKELRSLGEWKRQYPELNLVLISTDDPSQQDEVLKLLSQFQLQDAEMWIFFEKSLAHLRYSIDPSWHGELPRSYLYNVAHQRTAISGILKESTFLQWIGQTRQRLMHSEVSGK